MMLALIKAPLKLKTYLRKFQFEENFNLFSALAAGSETLLNFYDVGGRKYAKYINEFWTAKQRQASSLHEISYRACFKPQLPRFFIELLSKKGDLVYDPFGGRGTTAIEAGLLDRQVASNDINPLSKVLAYPRFFIPTVGEIVNRLDIIPLAYNINADIDLSMFYHPKTESEILSLRNYLLGRQHKKLEDKFDLWIRMIATNRLTGHSKGFFSVYTLPPNQAVSPANQVKINIKREQKPEYRNMKQIILEKTSNLLRNIDAEEKEVLRRAGNSALFLTQDARRTPEIYNNSVQLVVTSPPFLDVVNYSQDNWLRCWFNGINDKQISKNITMCRNINTWINVMRAVFDELFRVVKKGGWVAFEVGEVRSGTINLEEHVIPMGLAAGFECVGILVNMQTFTKTSNIWGIKNNIRGTNTNRVVIFYKK